MNSNHQTDPRRHAPWFAPFFLPVCSPPHLVVVSALGQSGYGQPFSRCHQFNGFIGDGIARGPANMTSRGSWGVSFQALTPKPRPGTATKPKSKTQSSPIIAADLGSLWQQYNVALEAHPLLVKSITASVIIPLADITAQLIESNFNHPQAPENALPNTSSSTPSASIDAPRVLRFLVFAFFLQAPWNHYWSLYLESILPTSSLLSTSSILKISLDSFVQAPIFTAIIFIFLGILEGKNKDEIFAKLKSEWWNTCKVGFLGIPVTGLNQVIVPVQFRVLVINIFFFFFATFLSFANGRKDTPNK